MKKRICFVVAIPATARAFLKDHIERLSQTFDVYLVGNIADEKEISMLKLAGYKSIRIERKPNPIVDIKALVALYKYLKKEKFDATHSVTPKASLLTAIAAFFARIPVRIQIFTGQPWADMTGLRCWIYKEIDRLTCRLNTNLLTDGRPQREHLIKNHIVKPERIQTLANGSICGVDISKFNPTDEVRKAVREELGYTENNVVFNFLGRLALDKGIAEILEAFNRLYETNREARLLFIGKDERNFEATMVKYPKLVEARVVRFFGFTPEPYKYLQAGDVYLAPSYWEGFGMAPIEAACMKLPLICSDAYGLADSLVEGKTGLICKMKDSETLYECMKKMYDDKEMRIKMGEEGRKRVEREFPKPLVLDAWEEYYKSLLLK